MNRRPVSDLSGLRFGRWKVLRFSMKKGPTSYWLCECDCGAQKQVVGGNLKSGRTISCGCYRAEELAARTLRHGQAGKSREYRIWAGMLQRCTNSARPFWYRYGGRGIQVCDRWRSFENFFSDMGPAPSLKHSIDRINNDGNYEPANCRWATAVEQRRNRTDYDHAAERRV